MIPMVDLMAQRRRLSPQVDQAIARVLEHGRFIMGPEVTQLEEELAAFSGARNCVSCASGTDALTMVLLAWEVGPGDAVFVPSFSFAATAEVVALVGAVPVFVDVLPGTFNMDPQSLSDAIGSIDKATLRPKAVIPVDLFGLPADHEAISAIATANRLHVLADAAQSFGASLHGRRTGSLAPASTISFFPAKPLGCYGDGGAIFTDDDDLASTLRSIREHGKGSDKYDNVRIGLNGRLDTLQAAVLLEKLQIFEDELRLRNEIAKTYEEGLAGVCEVPRVDQHCISAWAQYTIACTDRDDVASRLEAAGVASAVYYRKPLHLQPAYRSYPRAPYGLPISEELSRKVLSLPMHPYLSSHDQEEVIERTASAISETVAQL